MAGQGGVDRDVGGLGVTDLPHHDGIGVLTHDVAEAASEGEADPAPDFDLVDAIELVLNRVLDGDDLELIGEGRL